METNKEVKQTITADIPIRKQAELPKIKLGELKTNKKDIPGETQNDVRLPVIARMKKRLSVIQEDCAAKTTKYPRGSGKIHITIPGKIHIVNLEPVLSNPNFGTITCGLYKQDKDGNKIIKEQFAEIDGKKRLVNATPVMDKTVVETFEFRKKGVMEEFYDGGL